MNKQEFIIKISKMVDQHRHIDFLDKYPSEKYYFFYKKLGVKKVMAKNIVEDSIDNLKPMSLIYFFENQGKILKQILNKEFYTDICLYKIRNKQEYWCIGVGNNRPFFVKHFPELAKQSYIKAEITQVTIKLRKRKNIEY